MAATSFRCTSCRGSYRVMSNQAGRTVRCPHCRATATVPHDLFDSPPEILEDVSSDVSEPRVVPDDTAEDWAGSLRDATESLRSDASESTSPLYRATEARVGGMQFAYSGLARLTSRVGQVFLVVAVAVEIYILIMTEWSSVTDLPLKVAIPTIALTFVPAGGLAISGLYLMLMAHIVEYLARLVRGRT